MAETLTKMERAPDWIRRFSDEIDELRFGPGFERVGAGTSWSFGVERGVGRVALEALFHRIDEPLDSAHRLLDYWSGARTHIVRAEATVERKDGHAPAVDVPFVWIFTMGEDDPDRIDDIRIANGPIRTDAVL